VTAQLVGSRIALGYIEVVSQVVRPCDGPDSATDEIHGTCGP
jgi:hypothetical protein